LEKRKPSFDLERFKAVAGNPLTLDMTRSALTTARGLGFDTLAITRLVRSMTRSMFYKSMTSYADSRQWQDVYHVPADDDLTIYLKFTEGVVTGFTVLSFKEK
jgi:motility quorum-sensing regulator/GCU-specific mRNA interferase toxin